jgi:RHS repeat-associated protein
MMPSSKHGDPQLGVDIHLCTTPAGPVPLPTPHISMVFDPFDYIPFIGATVNVMGMKRATAGTGAITIHIPPGFPFAPMLPEKDDELFMGSATVVADGDPLSRLALPVLGCQIMGMPSPPRPKKKRIPKPTLLPTTFNLAIPGNVVVGGPPTISLMGLAARGAFAGLGKLAKSKLARNLGDSFKKFRQKLFKNMDSGFLKCKVLRAEPVNILTGEVVVEQGDFVLPGRIPIEWQRSYRSGSRRSGACGVGWESPADARLEIDAQDGSVLFLHPGEGPALFDRLPQAPGDAGAVLELMDGALLSDHGDEWRVRTKSDRTYHFRKALAFANAEGLQEVPLERIGDLCGNWLAYERVEGRLVGLRESSGRHLLIEQRDGRIRALTLFIPGTGFSHTFVSYGYDTAGNLVEVRDALGEPYRFAYDGHLMVRHTNRTGLSFHYEYQHGGDTAQVVHAWGDGGLYDYQFAYLPAIREVRITDSLGHVSTVQCDEHGLPILEIDPLDGRTVFEYDEVGRTTAVVDPADRRTAYTYDERGNLTKLTRADGSTIAIEVDSRNKTVAITDPNGAAWRQAWDERGLLVAQTSPLGAVTAYEYGPDGLLHRVIDALKASAMLGYDSDGYLTSVIDAQGHVSRFERDELGQVRRHTDPLGRATMYCHDAKGRLLEAVLPGGGTIRCEWDAQDNLTRHEDEQGAVTRIEYFGQGLVARRHQPDGHTVAYRYDTEEQLVGVHNQRGEVYELRRDPLGCVVQEVDYWGRATQYRLDAVGRLLQSCDPLGRCTDYTIDALGRIRRKSFEHLDQPGRRFEEVFEFDAAGNLTGCTNEHARVQREFDAEGRLVRERQNGFEVKNTYDALGRRVRRETGGHVVAYEYDALGRVANVQIDAEAPLTIERDAAGQVLKETLGAALQRHYRYDEQGRLTAQGVRRDAEAGSGAGPEWLFHTQYAYDAAGNLTQRQDSHTGTERYRYDPLGQVIEHVDPQRKLRRFFHDPAGDRLVARVKVAGESGGADMAWHREGWCEGVFYRFDAAGNLVERREEGHLERVGTDNGERKTTTLYWDANQRLVRSRSRPTLDSAADTVETIYGYDPLGRRVFKSAGDQCTWFGWDGDALMAEGPGEAPRPWPVTPPYKLVGIPKRQAESRIWPVWQARREYVYYPGTFVPLALVEGDASYRYHNDPNGCPTRLMRADGHVVWQARHEVWGQARVLVGEVHNPLRLQGQYEDEETGLHYNRHRYFDAVAGQFVSLDPIGLVGGLNIYQFGPNIFNWADPLGLNAQCQRNRRRGTSQYQGNEVRGFRNAGEIQERLGNLKNRLKALGINDATVGILGSSVTNVSSKGGSFRQDRVPDGLKASDVDFWVSSPTLDRKLREEFDLDGKIKPRATKSANAELHNVFQDFDAQTAEQLGRGSSVAILRSDTAESLLKTEKISY